MPQLDTTTYAVQGIYILLGLCVLSVFLWFCSRFGTYRFHNFERSLAIIYIFAFRRPFVPTLFALAGPTLTAFIIINAIVLPRVRRAPRYCF